MILQVVILNDRKFTEELLKHSISYGGDGGNLMVEWNQCKLNNYWWPRLRQEQAHREPGLPVFAGNYSPTNIFFRISLIIPLPFILLAVTPIIPSGSVPNAIDLECGFNGNTKAYPNPFTACGRLAWRVFNLSTWWLISVFGSGLNIIIYYLTSNSLSRGSRSCMSPLQ